MATDAEISLWTRQLSEAEGQYHRITIGLGVTRISLGDREVQNSPVNVMELRRYINDLRARLGLDPMSSPPRTAARRIMFR